RARTERSPRARSSAGDGAGAGPRSAGSGRTRGSSAPRAVARPPPYWAYPLARHHHVPPEVPPEIVGEALRSAVDLPAAERLEGLVVEHENPARRVAVGVADRAHVDPVGPAVDGVRPRVAGLLRQVLGLDRLHDAEPPHLGLRID